MTHLPDGSGLLLNLDSVELIISKYFPTKKDAAIFAEKIHQNADRDKIWQSTTITTQVGSGDSSVLTVIIDFSDGISKKMLGRLNALFHT